MINAQYLIFQRLAGDAALAGFLDIYNNSPALFTVPVPHEFEAGERACVMIDAPTDDENDDTYSEEYRIIDINIRVYGKPTPANGGTQNLSDAAAAVYWRLKRWMPENLSGGGKLVSATVSGPVGAPTTDPTLVGRLINVQIKLEEAA